MKPPCVRIRQSREYFIRVNKLKFAVAYARILYKMNYKYNYAIFFYLFTASLFIYFEPKIITKSTVGFIL